MVVTATAARRRYRKVGFAALVVLAYAPLGMGLPEAGSEGLHSKKSECEMGYWNNAIQDGGGGDKPVEFWIQYYREQFCDLFNLDTSFYEGKTVLDMGCGPLGTLEWATMAGARICMDPLSQSYGGMTKYPQKMVYVVGYGEEMPFAEASFDIVASHNNLDHVDDVQKTLEEVARVTKTGGAFLLSVHVAPGSNPLPRSRSLPSHRTPCPSLPHPTLSCSIFPAINYAFGRVAGGTECEPSLIQWAVGGQVKHAGFTILHESHWEVDCPTCKQPIVNAGTNPAFNHSRDQTRYGTIVIQAQRNPR